MSDRIKKIKIKQSDGTFSDYIPIGVDAKYVDMENGHNVENEIKRITPLEDNIEDINKKLKYDNYNPITSNNSPKDIIFNRKFCRNFNRRDKFNLCSMDFSFDWINGINGDPYHKTNTPASSIEYTETIDISKQQYSFYLNTENNDNKSDIRRLIGKFYPYAVYELNINSLTTNFYECRTGFSIINDKNTIDFYCAIRNNKIVVLQEEFVEGESTGVVTLAETEYDNQENFSFVLVNENKNWYIYLKFNNTTPILICSSMTNMTQMQDLMSLDNFNNTFIHLHMRIGNKEKVILNGINGYYDTGVAVGDIRTINYEDGSPLIENGKLFFLVDTRFNSNSITMILSNKIDTNDFEIEGILFFNYQDKLRLYENAACNILYDRRTRKWLVWCVDFKDNFHALAYGISYSDIRYGINIIDVTRMPIEALNTDGQPILTDDTTFKAKYGDEDPILIYNYDDNLWHLMICRLHYREEDQDNMYQYYHFTSTDPFTGYTYIDNTETGTVTGGSIIKVGNQYYLVCGSNVHVTSQYNVYKLNDLSNFYMITFKYNDGGYRGWGTLIPIPMGMKTKYLFYTFDRMNGSESNRWSYGNIYCYEGNKYNSGYEYDIRYTF